MERVGEWRVIEAEDPENGTRPPASDQKEGSPRAPLGGRTVMALAAAAVLGVAGAAIWMTLPQGGVTLDLAKVPAAELGGFINPAPTQVAVLVPALVVDVEGAVVHPGVHSVAAGGRTADAIAAAGGYSTEVDLAAAAGALNLAELLTDGQKIHVPARGEVATLPGATNAPGNGPPGLIDINHASADELDTLPGIGPVTAAKIIDARPFAAVDDLESVSGIGPSTMSKIRDLVTVTP